MDPVTSAFFNSIFPELVQSAPQALVDALAPVAQLQVSESVFPVPAQAYAQALVVAHMIQLGNNGGSGSVTGDRVGDVSTSYAALPTDKGHWNLTSYGMRFLALARLFRLPTMYVGGGPAFEVPPFGGWQPTWGRRPF